jgi:LysR family glycine cleavage system transcriptional activator
MFLKIPDIELLCVLRVVAIEGSFTRAALSMNLTQSAISHRVKKLERELGKTLFLRDSHRVDLTDAGTELLKAISPPLDQLESIFGQALPRRSTRTLEIELESAFASNWLAPRLSSFTALHPDVRIQLNVSHRQLEFSGETELAIKWGKGSWRGYEVQQLMSSRLTPMCAPTLIREGRLKVPADLAHSVLLHDRDHLSWRKWARAAGLKNLATDQGHLFQDTLMLQQAAINGHGVALYPIELGQDALRRGNLAAPFPETTTVGPGSYFVITRPRLLSRIALDFVTWLQTAVAVEGAALEI